MNWYISALKKYAVFSGRAHRAEYWMFTLFYTVFAVAAIILDNILGLTIEGEFYGVLYSLYSLAFFLPAISAAVRRLHDTGKSGWMFLISLIPIIGGIWLLVLLITAGDKGKNKYGPDPKAKSGKKAKKQNKRK